MTQGYNESSTQIFYGLSSDTKPTGCDNGSIFIEMDTKIGYIYDAANADWTEIPNGGGSQVEMDYNEATNKPAINDVTLSGNKTPASLGLQTRINPDSMLDADLVDDTNSDNKFVSATDIVNWNGKANADDVYTKTYMDTALAGKQAVIDDLSDIRSGATLGATSLQPSDVKSTYSSSGTDPVNGKAVAAAIGTLDVAAVGGSGSFISGISETNGKISATAGTVDSTPTESSTGLVTSAGIYTDQARQDALEAQDRAALIEVENKGAKNIAEVTAVSSTAGGVDYTVNPDGTVIANRTSSSTSSTWFRLNESLSLKAGTYVLSGGKNSGERVLLSPTTSLSDAIADSQGSGAEFTLTEDTDNLIYAIRVAYTDSPSNVKFYPMICSKAEWDISNAFVPYGKTNADLTLLEKQDRDGLATAIDKGAKNLLKLGFTHKSAGSQTADITADGNGIIVNGDRNTTTDTILVYDLVTNQSNMLDTRYTLPAGKYVIPSTGTQNLRYQVYCHDGTNYQSLGYTMSNPLEFEYTSTLKAQYPYIAYRLWASRVSSFDNFTTYPMICTKAEWDVSHQYEPYAPTNRELYEDKATVDDIMGLGTPIASNTDLDTITQPGTYYCLSASIAQTLLHSPVSQSFRMLVTYTNTSAHYDQIIFTRDAAIIYRRSELGSGFSDWAKFSATLDEIPTANSTNAVMSGGVQAPLAELVDNGAKNLLNPKDAENYLTQGTFPINRSNSIWGLSSDGIITVTTTTVSNATVVRIPITLPAGSYHVGGSPASGSDTSYRVDLRNPGLNTFIVNDYDYGNGIDLTLSSETVMDYCMRIGSGYNDKTVTFSPIICTKTQWDISNKYEPHAIPNAPITSELIELVDGGAKNLLKNTLGSGTKSRLEYTTGTDGSIVITAGTAQDGNADFVIPFTPKESGQYVLQGCPSGGSGTTYKGQITLYPSMTNVVEIFDNTSVTATLTGGTQYAYRFRVYSGKAIGDVTIYPMVCSLAAWKISKTYQPYAKSNREATLNIDGVDIIATSDSHADLNNYTDTGLYIVRGSAIAQYIDNCPVSARGFALQVWNLGGSTCVQEIIDPDVSAAAIYIRRKISSSWRPWFKFEGTEVT